MGFSLGLILGKLMLRKTPKAANYTAAYSVVHFINATESTDLIQQFTVFKIHQLRT